jgi:Holliday junction resolvase RusA-like endonuclease
MWESNKKLKGWRDQITQQVKAEMLEQFGQHKSLKIAITFDFIRPKSSKRVMPNVKPDQVKLTRAVLDALTKSGIYHDDAQVVSIKARKTYVASGGGCSILIDGIDFERT